MNKTKKGGIFNYEETASIFIVVFALFYLWTNSIGWAIVVGCVITFAVAYTLWGSHSGIPWHRLNSLFKQRKPNKGTNTPTPLYSLNLGHSTSNRGDVYQLLPHMGHIFVAGMTRYGKTVLIQSWIKYLIETHSSNEMLLAFSDAKQVSFNIYGRLEHLFAPIAKSPEQTEMLLRKVKKEMENRLALFSEIDGKICANVDDYHALTGERLPWLLVIFDELSDSVAPKSEAEEMIVTIAKMGLATGIQLILATQRPTNYGVSHEAQSQCATLLCTYMKSSQEYRIATIPSDVYKLMKPKKGLFMVYSPELAPVFLDEFPELEGWGFIQGQWIEKSDLEAAALTRSGDEPVWEKLPEWGGSAQDKIDAIRELHDLLGRKPSKTEIAKSFNITQKTAGTWYERTYSTE